MTTWQNFVLWYYRGLINYEELYRRGSFIEAPWPRDPLGYVAVANQI